MIGKENPFGSNCSAIVSKFHSKNQKWGMMIILGPMRMDYGRNIGLLKYAKILLEQL
jgi:transcriptional regulator of heat shock response